MKESSISEYLENKKKLIDSSLQHFLEESKQTSILFASMSYSVFSGGKRIRPILLLAVYESIKGFVHENCIIPACALEFIHTYSLIHDDLPCMDNSAMRRGKPTTHKLYGEDIALLAGDALLTEAFYLLSSARARELFSAEIGFSLIHELSKMSGTQGMVEGQAFEMIQGTKNLNEDTLLYIMNHKTAALFDASLSMGGISAGINKTELEVLGKIGRLFGIAFQLADDLHDFTTENQELNYVNLMGKEKTISMLNNTMKQCINTAMTLSFDTKLLQDIFYFIWEKEFQV